MRPKPLKVGIVGCGAIADSIYLPTLVRDPRVSVVGICDTDDRRLESAAAKFKIKGRYSDMGELIRVERPDAMFILTPPTTHAPLVVAAATAGCHVFVEKPMAVTTVELEMMLEAVSTAGVRIGVDHNMLFSPSYMKAMKMLRCGQAGDLVSFSVRYTKALDGPWLLDPNHWSHLMPGGILGEALAHPLYLAVFAAGALDLQGVFARKVGDKPWVQFDELRLVFANGEIVMSANSARETGLIHLYCTKQDLLLDLWSLSLVRKAMRKLTPVGFAFDNFSVAAALVKETGIAATKTVFGRMPRGSVSAIRAWIESLLNDSQYIVTVEQIREVTRLFEEVCVGIEKQADGRAC